MTKTKKRCSKCKGKHFAKGLCQRCYFKKYMKRWRAKNSKKENIFSRFRKYQQGLVKNPSKPVTKKQIKQLKNKGV